MDCVIRFAVPGQPLPTERPRPVRPGSSKMRTPRESLEAQARVALAFRQACPGHRVDADWAWAVRLLFYRETMATADVDNLAKTPLDALAGAIWANDRQVADLHVTRYLGAGKGQGCTVVEARPIGTLADTIPRP